MYWELCEANANDSQVVKVAKEAAKKLEDGDVVIWDRLGRSGRVTNPQRQHYSPEAVAAFESHGATAECTSIQ